MRIKLPVHAPISFAFMMACCSIIIVACVNNFNLSQGGSGTEIGNPTVTGKVVDAQGSPAGNVQVTVRPAGFDPVIDGPTPDSDRVTTGPDGIYSFSVAKNSAYTIEAVHRIRRTRAMLADVAVGEVENRAPQCTLNTPGVIKVMVPWNADTAGGFVFIPGTSIFKMVKFSRGFVLLDSVPVGLVAQIVYSSTNTAAATTLRNKVTVTAGDTAVVVNPGWNYSRKITLNTSATGANTAGTVTNFPVLIRLTTANFDFTQARNNGEDIRFTKRDTAVLPYEIERWDPIGKRAEMWVKLDTLYGNDSAQAIIMAWGNIDAPAQSNSTAVFDTASGFQGVWHLSGAGNANAGDATLHHYDGTPTDTAPQAISGIIGTALQFDGNANGLVMKNTGHSPLNFSYPGAYTFSAWVSVDTVYDADEFIAGKGHDQYSLRVKGRTSYPSNLFALQEYVDAPIYGAEMRLAPVVTQQWKYIVGIRDTAKSYLFIDGVCVDSSGTIFYSKGDVQDSTSFSIGRCAASYTAPANSNNYLAFKGKIDEVRIANVACTADWVKLCYMNQKEQDALIKW